MRLQGWKGQTDIDRGWTAKATGMRSWFVCRASVRRRSVHEEEEP